MKLGGTRTVRRISSSEARKDLAAVLEEVGTGRARVLIERRGKSPIALVSVDELLRYELLEGLVAQKSRRA